MSTTILRIFMKLREYIQLEFEGSATDFAKKVGVSRQCINYWINCKRTPSLKLIRKIEKLTGYKVTVKDW